MFINGEQDQRRGRKLRVGDIVVLNGNQTIKVI